MPHHSSISPALRTTLKALEGNFSASYVAVQSVLDASKRHPEKVTFETVHTLEKVLTDPSHAHERNAQFLYKDAAQTLCNLFLCTPENELGQHCFALLTRVARQQAGHQRIAAAKALGCLPVTLSGPEEMRTTTQDVSSANAPEIQWKELLWCLRKDKNLSPKTNFSPIICGRSLIHALKGTDTLLVIKLARKNDSPAALRQEALWMNYLRLNNPAEHLDNHVPEPIAVEGSYLMRLQDAPLLDARLQNGTKLHPGKYALCYLAPATYFDYPNDHRPGRRLTDARFYDSMGNSAYLLGRHMARGIAHNAAIPLFHNRVQLERRDDLGLYRWDRLGRLDRWLESCRYPNFGLSGLRDFEHFDCLNNSGEQIYRQIGDHFLSLFLVIGSFFRHKDPDRVGMTPNETPPQAMDARDLFDKSLLKDLLYHVFTAYYEGFTQTTYNDAAPADFQTLTARIIEEMGVDKHMEEVLRVEDQKLMPDRDFRALLRSGGYGNRAAARVKRNRDEITVYSGPHLGKFNSKISLPELIDYVATCSGLCVAGLYCTQNNINPTISSSPAYETTHVQP